MQLKSTKPWHAGTTVNFPFVGSVEVDENGRFEVEDHESALQLIDSSIGIEASSSLEDINPKAHLFDKGLEGGEEDDNPNEGDNKLIKETIDLMSRDKLREFAEEQGLPKNKWQRMGLEKLKEYVLTEMGL